MLLVELHGDDPEELLERAERLDAVARERGSGEAMAVLVYEWRSLSEEGQAQVLALRDIYEELWLQVLGEARDAGLIGGDVFITRRFLTGALSWTTTWFRAGGSLSLDQLADEALIMVLKEPR